MIDPLAEEDEDLSPYNYGENNPILMTDPDGMAADSTNKPKPPPPPIQLKEVVIKSGPHKGYVKTSTNILGLNWITYEPSQAMKDAAARNRAQAADFLERWTPVGREAMFYLNINDISKQVNMSKIGTPRKKSAKQLRKEWERATGKTWPKEPTRNQVAHHIKPLADGGDDGYPNIEPEPADEHRSWHQALGDFVRWGSTRAPDVD